MKRNKYGAISLSLALFFSVSAIACTHGGGKNKNWVESEKSAPTAVTKVYTAQTGGENSMIIGGFWGPFDADPNRTGADVVNGVEYPNFLTDYYFNLLDEAEVNMLWATGKYYGQSGFIETLDLAQKYGMGVNVLHSTIYGWTAQTGLNNLTTTDVKAVCDSFIDHPAVTGVYMLDEPFANQFTACGEFHDLFMELYGDKGKIVAQTMVAHNSNRHGYNFVDEMNKYLDETNMEFLCIDDYTWDQGGGSLSNTMKILSNTRMLTQAKGVPFMNMLQTGGQWTDGGEALNSAAYYPTEGQFMWNYNNALAFGAKGILFFPLFQPYTFTHTEGGGSDFGRNGMIGADGKINQWYYYAKKQNTYTRFIEEILMNSMSEGIIPSGTALKDTVGCVGLLDAYKQLKTVSGDSIVGCFNYNGATMLYVVNYSIEDKGQVSLSFDNCYKYDVYQRATKATVIGEDITLTLEAGEGALITLY